MKRLLIGLSLWLWSATAALALCEGADFRDRLSAEDRARVAEAVAATPYAEGLIWEAVRGDTRLTIAGTMHLYDPRHAPLRARLAEPLERADILLVEAGDEEQAAMESAIATQPDLVFITEGPTLPELLDEETWDALAEAARARGMPPFMLAKMQPWYVALTLSMPPCILPDLLSGRTGLDGMLIDDAQAAGVPVRALEPWTTLFDIMRSDDMGAQIENLRLSLIAPELQSEMFVAMLDAYFAEDVAEVWEVSRLAARYVPGLDPATGERLFVEMEEALLADRNRAWMDVIADAVARHDDVMIAVGAAHLPGDTGLLKLLESDGWRIAPLP